MKLQVGVYNAGPLLARCGKVTIAAPGGCAIGSDNKRPVNLHMDILTAMGATIEVSGGKFAMSVENGLHGADVEISFPSVGATCTYLLAAASATGASMLRNAALEPEVRMLFCQLPTVDVGTCDCSRTAAFR